MLFLFCNLFFLQRRCLIESKGMKQEEKPYSLIYTELFAEEKEEDMKNSKRAFRVLAWLLTMTLIFTMSFSSIAYAAEPGTTGEGEEAAPAASTDENEAVPTGDNEAAPSNENEEASIGENHVAAIGQQGYETLAEAVAAAGTDETTIVVLKDVENLTTLQIGEGQNILLDLNGNKLEAALRTSDRHYYAIDNYGTLTINDSSEAGTGLIIARGIENLENGNMTINGGTIEACDSNGGASIWNVSDLTVNGGTFKTTHVGTPSDSYGPGCLNNSGKALITGGSFDSVNKRTYSIISTGEIEITPAEGKAVSVKGAHGALAIDSGTAAVNGGTYYSDDYYGLYVSNDGVGTDPMKAAVTVNGGSFEGPNYSVWIGSDYNNPVNSTIEINGGEFKKPLNAQECTREGAIVVKGGYLSNRIPEGYLAQGKTLVESDKAEYTYMVADKKVSGEEEVDLKPAVGEVTLSQEAPSGLESIEVTEKALDAAVRSEINSGEIAVDEQSLEGAAEELNPQEGEALNVYVQAYLDVQADDDSYTGGENTRCVLEITPMYRVVASTAANSESILLSGENRNAVVLGQPNPLEVKTALEVTIPLPEGFVAKADSTVTIKHTKENGKVYYYSAKVETKDGKTFATFTNPNGFSTFEVLQYSDNAALQKVALNCEDGNTIETAINEGILEYTIKFDAGNNIPDSVNAEVAAEAADSNARVKVLVGGIEVKEKRVDIGLGTTTFSVLVLAEDDTAAIYTFEAVRCELVEEIALDKNVFVYNGKAQTPSVTALAGNGEILTENTDYTVNYEGSKVSVGTHTVTAYFKGKYEGTASKTYTINPAKPSIKKIKSSKKKLTVYMSAKPSSKGAKYYRIYYKQKGAGSWKSVTTSSSYKTIKSLKKGKRYYVKVYAYSTIDGVTYKSAYSTTNLSKKIR